ncbi:PREDICTED: geranylgeranyl transferase type-2 subunit alpha [Haliaeetus leucocephalus]|uniref:geranylgeranyl transferase type-2 subunit alpha n=1 Tax=Haliaeetus leucocephalus TaxID=52644 RepID=UPI00053CE3D4|nr:PREDICTED: geranylgeranyl transferase type-2 subunit alpha [Haliaeetus leucocephalus]
MAASSSRLRSGSCSPPTRHGRLKLRPPDAARRRQREEKLRLYRSAMATLLEKRERGELDAEALALTGAVLAANPDVGTCWNLRRCALPPDPADWSGLGGTGRGFRGPGRALGWTGRRSVGTGGHWEVFRKGSVGTGGHGMPMERFHGEWGALGGYWKGIWGHWDVLGGDQVPGELAFVVGCLGVNPKSYGAWHHRGWVLRRAPAPPPAPAERALCDRLLAADPRNFHAWEHRRTLAAEEDPEAELAFAGTLLSRDFSNFSAWHHRSRLLAPTRTPTSPGGGAGALPPHRLQTELELVQNAVFTDPNDQSAWVYLRCILSRASPPPRILCLYVNREDATLAVTFSRPVVVSPDFGVPPPARHRVHVGLYGSVLVSNEPYWSISTLLAILGRVWRH